MSPEFESVFTRLREILRKNSATWSVKESPTRFELSGEVGPATLRAWGGKVRSQTIPVAWVTVEKSYVSFHLMALYGNDKLLTTLSPALKQRMQGKTCFNFKTVDEALFEELRRVTAESLRSLKRAGFIADMPVPDR